MQFDEIEVTGSSLALSNVVRRNSLSCVLANTGFLGFWWYYVDNIIVSTDCLICLICSQLNMQIRTLRSGSDWVAIIIAMFFIKKNVII